MGHISECAPADFVVLKISVCIIEFVEVLDGSLKVG